MIVRVAALTFLLSLRRPVQQSTQTLQIRPSLLSRSLPTGIVSICDPRLLLRAPERRRRPRVILKSRPYNILRLLELRSRSSHSRVFLRLLFCQSGIIRILRSRLRQDRLLSSSLRSSSLRSSLRQDRLRSSSLRSSLGQARLRSSLRQARLRSSSLRSGLRQARLIGSSLRQASLLSSRFFSILRHTRLVRSSLRQARSLRGSLHRLLRQARLSSSRLLSILRQARLLRSSLHRSLLRILLQVNELLDSLNHNTLMLGIETTLCLPGRLQLGSERSQSTLRRSKLGSGTLLRSEQTRLLRHSSSSGTFSGR